MDSQIPDITGLVQLLQFEEKKELLRYAKNMSIGKKEFFTFLLAAQRGVFLPYKYANHFAQTAPEHLYPNEIEQKSIAENGVGLFKSKPAQKFASKIFQFAQERRSLAAHLLYTADHRFWHLFYFDSHDVRKHRNHWQFGPHLHYVGFLWHDLNLEIVWDQVLKGRISLRNKAHIRYQAEP